MKHRTGGIHIDACRNELDRFPANFIHDGLEEDWAKFFYCPKTSKSEKGKDNNHPTVKPLKLMRCTYVD